MSSRLDDILALLEQCTKQALEQPNLRMGLDASSIADSLDIHRSDASRLLNRLAEESQAVKLSGRPVRYLHAGVCQNILKVIPARESYAPEELMQALRGETIAEDKPSVFDKYYDPKYFPVKIINSAKASISYPPKGLPALIIGPTGCGKTFLVDVMYQYGIETGRYSKANPFIRFNCSDYANNPQLLLSQLFGHEAGAYTDAKNEKRGLVELAEDGILFLDEVHSLPPQGQEMLFSIIDKGTYRRMGETNRERSANVLLLLATNYNPREALIPTLLRRIPITIELPPLSKRSQAERFSLIKRAFTQESTNIQKRIIVSKEVVSILMRYECPGNTGQLMADIKSICSQAYLDCTLPPLRVGVGQLSDDIILQAMYSISNRAAETAYETELCIYPAGDSDDTNAPLCLSRIFKFELRDNAEPSAQAMTCATEIYFKQFRYMPPEEACPDAEIFAQLGRALHSLQEDKNSFGELQYGIYYAIKAAVDGEQMPSRIFAAMHKMAAASELLEPTAAALHPIEPLLRRYSISPSHAATLLCWMRLVVRNKGLTENKIYLLSSDGNSNRVIAHTVNKLLDITNIEPLDAAPMAGSGNGQDGGAAQGGTNFVVMEQDTAALILSHTLSERMNMPVRVLFHDISTTNIVVLTSKIIQNEWDHARVMESLIPVSNQAAIDLRAVSVALVVCSENEPCCTKIKEMLGNLLNLSGNRRSSIRTISFNQCGSYGEIDRRLSEMMETDNVGYVVDMVNFSYSHSAMGVVPFEVFLKHTNLIDFASILGKRGITHDFGRERSSDISFMSEEELAQSIRRYVSFIDIGRVQEAFTRCVVWLDRSLSYKITGFERTRLYVYMTFMLERVISGHCFTVSSAFNLDERTRKLVENISYTIEKAFRISIPVSERMLLGKMVFERNTDML